MKISIVGCGWLGLPLASHLLSEGHTLHGTTRNQEKVSALTSKRIQSHLFTLGDPLNTADLAPLFSVDVLVLNLPPGRRTLDEEHFVTNMCHLIDHCLAAGCANLLFVSTTSVYGNAQGRVDESTPTSPNTASGRAHVAIEQHVKQVYADHGGILRLAGLVDEQRHPVNFLAGRQGIEHGQQVVNLVHRDDVIAAISAILTHSAFGETYLMCSTDHPTRQAYYTWAANAKGLPEPQFAEPQADLALQGKTIDATRSLDKLGLKLVYPSPYNMI